MHDKLQTFPPFYVILTACSGNYALTIDEYKHRDELIDMTHAVLVSLDGDIDITLAPSYDAALKRLRERAEAWDWDEDWEHRLDRQTATVEQLSALYTSDGENATTTWVQIVELITPCRLIKKNRRTKPSAVILGELHVEV